MDNIEKVSIIDDILQQLHILLFNENKRECSLAIDQTIYLLNTLFKQRFEEVE